MSPEMRPHTARAHKIAALHAMADWFAQHPEAPMPAYVVASYHLAEDDEVDERTRVATIMSVAHRHGHDLIEGARTVQGDLGLDSPPDMQITYRVAAMKDRQDERKYLR